MRRLEIDRRGEPAFQRRSPTRYANTPAISRFKPGKSPLRMRRHKIVAIEHREIEEIARHLHADRVQSFILRTRAAISVAKKPSHRIAAAGTKLRSENIRYHVRTVASLCRKNEAARASLPHHRFHMSDTYVENAGSIVACWLMPAEPEAGVFRSIVADLAAEFDAPVFEPHLTIYAGAIEAGDVLDGFARKSEPISLCIESVQSSELFTKTVFAQFEPSAALTGLSSAFRRESRGQDEYDLNPHRSLIYKTMAAEARERIASEVSLPFAEVRFDAIQVVACPIPIRTRADVEAWRVLGRAALGNQRL